MADCIIDDCRNNARHNLGIRLRRPWPRTAIWAPDLNAFVCDEHAAAGMNIEIILTPTDTRQIETEVRTERGASVRRTTPIRSVP